MRVALQIREVPEGVRDVLAQAASLRGQSLQAYLLDLVTREARALRNATAFGDAELAAARVRLPDDFDLTAIIREGRDNGFAADRSR